MTSDLCPTTSPHSPHRRDLGPFGIKDCPGRPTTDAARHGAGDAPTTVRPLPVHDDFQRVTAELEEAVSMLARIGDAISPTGERPEEALGTLVADVEAIVQQRDAALDRLDLDAWERDNAERDQLRRLLDQTTAALNVALHHANDNTSYSPTTDYYKQRAAELDGCRIALQDATEATTATTPALGSARARPHVWTQPTFQFRWSHCSACGVVRRRDNQSGPCKGPARVAPRAQDPHVQSAAAELLQHLRATEPLRPADWERQAVNAVTDAWAYLADDTGTAQQLAETAVRAIIDARLAGWGRPDCTHELHGADGGPCPRCGWDSHPIPTTPA